MNSHSWFTANGLRYIDCVYGIRSRYGVFRWWWLIEAWERKTHKKSWIEWNQLDFQLDFRFFWKRKNIKSKYRRMSVHCVALMFIEAVASCCSYFHLSVNYLLRTCSYGQWMSMLYAHLYWLFVAESTNKPLNRLMHIRMMSTPKIISTIEWTLRPLWNVVHECPLQFPSHPFTSSRHHRDWILWMRSWRCISNELVNFPSNVYQFAAATVTGRLCFVGHFKSLAGEESVVIW